MTSSHSQSGVLLSLRLEFLNQSFRRLSAQESPASVYSLAALWQLNSALLRVLHICALVDKGGSKDNEAVGLIDYYNPSSLRHRDLMIDSVTASLRMRLGLAVSRVTGMAQYGQLVATMDSEACAWVRGCVSREKMMEGNSLEEIGNGIGKERMASTRELILKLQSLLLTIPLKERLSGSSGHGKDEKEREEEEAIRSLLVYSGSKRDGSNGNGSGATTWFERKERCDALLSLSNAFLQWGNSLAKS